MAEDDLSLSTFLYSSMTAIKPCEHIAFDAIGGGDGAAGSSAQVSDLACDGIGGGGSAAGSSVPVNVLA